jgi:transglutaminase-like putative cysteine protease
MLKLSPGRWAIGLLAALLLLISSAADALAKGLEYQVGPAPAWVHPVAAASASRRQGSGYGGTESLLSDSQTRIEADGITAYRHYVSKALDSKGVQEVAAISLSFDPTYQKLTLIAVDVLRDGHRIAKIGSATIRVLHRETELEYQLFDGNKTVNVAIDDVRVGDIVEYAYSLSGLNPVFNNRVAGGAYLQWGVPVDRVFVRLLVPPGRHISLSARNTKAQAAVTQTDGYSDYRWDLDSVRALRVEKDAPPGFDPYASVQWSEFPDWKAVVAWALPLYRIPDSVGADVMAEVARIRAAHAAPEQRLLAVLHLVQRDIRYLGVEVGPGSHAPTAPALVYKRRFGDCKDKAMLTLSMLTALGIEARPALVQTDRSLSADLAANPHAFNHVIVRAIVNGKTYWIDPTRAPQKGDLDHLYQPDYGLALVLEQASGALVRMTPPVAARTVIRSVFDAGEGADRPVRYTISTTVQGAAAERMRADIASRGLADKEMEYLNYYARTYPGITLAAPLSVDDDETNNTLSMTEHYAIAKFWSHTKGEARREAFIDAAEINAKFSAPAAVNRIAPLKVSFPDEIDEQTVVNLPEVWSIANSSSTVTDDAFEYVNRVEQRPDGRSIVLTNTYKALADRVQPRAMAAYAAHLRRADNQAGFSLYWNGPDAPAATAPAKGNSRSRVTAAILLAWTWFGFGIVWLTAPPSHRSTDRKLFFTVLAVTAPPLAVAMWPGAAMDVLLVGLLSFALGTRLLPKIAAGAPETHWLYPLTHRRAAEPAAMRWPGLIMFLGLHSALLLVGLCAYQVWTQFA